MLIIGMCRNLAAYATCMSSLQQCHMMTNTAGRSGEEAGKLQEMYSKLSKRSTLNILFRAVTVVPMHTSIHSSVDLCNKSEVNQGTLFAISRLFLLPSMAENSSSIYNNH